MVKTYSLKYSDDGTTWKDYNGGEILTGNTDANTPVEHTLIPFIAKYIRVYPLSGNGFTSMRYEIYVQDPPPTVNEEKGVIQSDLVTAQTSS